MNLMQLKQRKRNKVLLVIEWMTAKETVYYCKGFNNIGTPFPTYMYVHTTQLEGTSVCQG